MSMAVESGASEASPVSDISAGEGSPNPAVAAGDTGSSASVSGGDITDPSTGVVEKDASYWEGQSKHFQSLYDKQQEQFRGILNSGAEPDVVLNAAQQYANLVQHPVFGGIVNEFARTGQVNLPVPTSDDNDEDEYLDPATKALRDELSTLKSEIASMRNDQGQVQRTQSVENFRSLTRNFLGKYQFDEVELAEIAPVIEKEFAKLTNTDAGLKQVLSMDERTFSMVALPIIEPYRDNAVRRQLQADASKVRGAATDAPISAGTTGAEAGSQDFGNMKTRDIAKQVLTEELTRAGKL